MVVVVAVGFFVVVVVVGFWVVVVGLLVTVVPALLLAGLLVAVLAELLSVLLVADGCEVPEVEVSLLSELFCLSELSDEELSCLSELVLSEASEDKPLSEDVVSSSELLSCETVEEDTVDVLVDTLPLSELQPQADIMTAAHSIREMIRFFIFLFPFCLL